LPAYVAPDGSRSRGSLATNDMWIIPEGSTRASAASEYIKWMAGPAGSTQWALNGGDPISTVPYGDPEVLAVRPDFAVAAEANLYADTFPDLPEAPELLSIWSELTARTVEGELSAKEAMDEIASQWEDVLSNAGYYE
jgi:multiple sugar transport system substrate-binding protein